MACKAGVQAIPGSFAAELGSSSNKIGTHAWSIYRKPQAHSKSEAAAKAIRDGLV